MTIAKTIARARAGIYAREVMVESHIANGLPKFLIVGLAETTVKESKERVRSAILNCYFHFPSRRITVNLAPADLPKNGGCFDLAIAIGILIASGQLPKRSPLEYEFAAELALSGELRPIKGVLPVAMAAKESGRALIISRENLAEAQLVQGLEILPADHLLDICAHLKEQQLLQPAKQKNVTFKNKYDIDIAEVKGQAQAKRALEIAAAGGHNLLLFGPPGTGKTMLASRLPTILPTLSEKQALEVAAVHSIHNKFSIDNWRLRPFQNPHHTTSHIAVVGGGRPPRPGEVSLAHNGVLFLDEIAEFGRQVLESLREPLEAGTISISRASYQETFPAQFQLIAAMNPCPCGFQGHPTKNCRCTPTRIENYQQKLSGPFLDRIDMFVETTVDNNALSQQQPQTSSEEIRITIQEMHDIQNKRQQCLNTRLTNTQLKAIAISDDAKKLLMLATEKLQLSMRAHHRVLKVARTIADFNKQKAIEKRNIEEALSFRRKDNSF